MNWKEEKKGETITEIIENLSGYKKENLIHSEHYERNFHVANAIFSKFEKIAKAKESIFLLGDYDADGITSCLILSLLFRKMGIKYNIHIPYRISEGYGISEKTLSHYNGENHIVTVDNGIAGKEFLDKIGVPVIVIDHHLSETIPNGLIFDPEIFHEEDFSHYCGAGLCYKIALSQGEDYFKGDEKTLEIIKILACIGTISDVMPLVDENRKIVKEGLALINNGAWSEFLGELSLPKETSASDIGFKIGPIINATGRLYDDGGMIVYKELLKTIISSRNGIHKLVQNNEMRKVMQDKFIKEMNSSLRDTEMYPNLVYVPNCPEGLLGILAGRLAEDTGKASFVVSDTPEGYLKGSARGDEQFDVSDFLQKNKELFIKAGGHVGAGGFSLTKDNFEKLLKKCKKNTAPTKPSLVYHKEITDLDTVPMLYEEQEQFEPFGEGVPKPVLRFLIEVSNHRYMKDGKMVKLSTIEGIDVLSFSHGEYYKEAGEPHFVEVIGTLSKNYFMGRETIQIEVIDMKAF